jgi:hypothetical protein
MPKCTTIIYTEKRRRRSAFSKAVIDNARRGGFIDKKIHITSVEVLQRLDSALGKFSEDIQEKIEAAQRVCESQLAWIDERCRQLERELRHWEEEYDSADDDEDDTGYLAYKRDETAENLARARQLQRQVEETYENLARRCRKISAITDGRLSEARAFLRQKGEELRNYAAVALPGADGLTGGIATPSASYNSTSASSPDSASKRAERLTPEVVERRYRELSQSGHAVQKHGYEITEEQLDKRVIYGIDPAGRAKNKFTKHATKFTSALSLVKAEEYVRNSREYKDSLADVLADGKESFVVKNIKLENVLGPDYKNQVFGKTRIGTTGNPVGTKLTDFTDGTVKAVFVKDAGQWNLETLFPKPDQKEA